MREPADLRFTLASVLNIAETARARHPETAPASYLPALVPAQILVLLVIDLIADPVFLPIQTVLFRRRNMPAMMTCEPSFSPPNRAVFAMQLMRFGWR